MKKTLCLQFKHWQYQLLTVLLTLSTTIRSYKWRTFPKTSITCGLPQGSILEPLLVDIFIGDLPQYHSYKSAKSDLFADDDTLNTGNDDTDNIRRDLLQNLHNVSDWCRTDLMAFKQTKTKRVLMATRWTSERKVLFEYKSLFHTNKTGFRMSG